MRDDRIRASVRALRGDKVVLWAGVIALIGLVAIGSGAAALLSAGPSAGAFLEVFGGSCIFCSGAALLAVAHVAVAEIEHEREDRTAEAVAEERRRLARELHDGVAQDLAYIATQSDHLARRSPELATLGQIAGAARRALSESRTVISELSDGHAVRLLRDDTELREAIEQHASELADRANLELWLEMDEGVETTPEIGHAVLRIVGEAISNASRHGLASSVHVTVSAEGESLVVGVRDDGRGFDPDRVAAPAMSGGYGLAGISARARALGGELRLESAPGRGTRLEVGF